MKMEFTIRRLATENAALNDRVQVLEVETWVR